MTEPKFVNIAQQLNEFSHPLLSKSWAEQFLQQKKDNIQLIFPFAANALIKELNVFIQSRQGVLEEIIIKQQVASIKPKKHSPIRQVKNIIVISSAKGGVGKSTAAANLALALQAQGAKVGMLDADIYGPSLPLMLGAQDKTPESLDEAMMEPVMAHGLATNSIGYLISNDEAMVWRGPMASKAFAQLLNETNWGELDYLVIDMPPGTGDIQLSLAQQFPVTAAIVITTPQDLALIDAMKGVMMFNKVDVPVLGVIENMSYHICENCGYHENIFGEGGAEFMAKEQGIRLLGQLPLAAQIRADIDAGTPTVIANPEGEYAKRYFELASKVASELYWQGEVMPNNIAIQLV